MAPHVPSWVFVIDRIALIDTAVYMAVQQQLRGGSRYHRAEYFCPLLLRQDACYHAAAVPAVNTE